MCVCVCVGPHMPVYVAGFILKSLTSAEAQEA